MPSFIGEKYLLRSGTALRLFKGVRDLPIVDPHNHADVAELAENRNYRDPWRLFAETDHYVWEVMRKRSVPEEFITGGAPPMRKWLELAAVFPEIAGNPVYEWIHLDLRRSLGIGETLGPGTGRVIWDKASKVLARKDMRPLQLLGKMGVEVMCSTDDPADLLENHSKVNAAAGRTLVRPTWRPDKAVNIFSPGWPGYVRRLGERFGIRIGSLDELMSALSISHDYFHECGCRASDHGVRAPLSGTPCRAKAAKAFRKALRGARLSDEETAAFMGHVFGEIAEFDSRRGWVFQIHVGAVRDVRDSLFESLGPDTGGDVSDHFIDVLGPLRPFLNRFDGRLKVVLYCLDPGHQATLATLARAFGSDVRLGSAWWLCDTPVGMKRQLEYVGSVDLLANFAGMVSDSRKLLSYGSRHEMFRRVLCDVLGDMVGCGQMPEKAALSLARRICYSGPKEFFGI